jgi:hypothetical protein
MQQYVTELGAVHAPGQDEPEQEGQVLPCCFGVSFFFFFLEG